MEDFSPPSKPLINSSTLYKVMVFVNLLLKHIQIGDAQFFTNQ
jgi:hypothetical protein